MQRITWYALLAVVALVAPTGGRAQAPQQKAPQANVRELATIEGNVSGFVRLPGGRTLIYTVANSDPWYTPRVEDSTFTYEIATKRRTLLGTNMLPEWVSPLGDRLAFSRSSEDRKGIFLWTIPIDPKTGLATGPAQRVSLRPTRGRAAFSPDGKVLAVVTGPRPDGTGTGDVTLVPATGGAEHVVANGARELIGWSADGKSLYFRSNNPATDIKTVAVAGGPSELLVPRTPLTSGEIVGLSPDAGVAFFQNEPDRFFYRTASGVEGEISVALPPLDDGHGYNMFEHPLESMRYTTMTQVRNQSVRVLDLSTGQARDLVPGVQTSAPAWSPDGRRLAVLSGSLSHFDITVVNADGSSARRYKVPMRPDGRFGAWGMPWSPDGRFLAFLATDRQKVGGGGPDDQSQLALLDLSTGETRVLTASSAAIPFFRWRSDGKALRAIKNPVVPKGSPQLWTIVEVLLNGEERPLRDIPAEFAKATGVRFISDREAVVRVATDQRIERFVVPLDGGAARRLPDPGFNLNVVGGPVAENRVAIPQYDGSAEVQALKLLSTVGDSTLTVRLPIPGSESAGLPDGKKLVTVGKATGDSLYRVHLVPLDGSGPRLIGEIPGGVVGLSPSPDGRFVAYTSQGRITSKIHEIDFGPALQAIVKR